MSTKDKLKQVVTALATDNTELAESLFKEVITAKMKTVIAKEQSTNDDSQQKLDKDNQ